MERLRDRDSFCHHNKSYSFLSPNQPYSYKLVVIGCNGKCALRNLLRFWSTFYRLAASALCSSVATGCIRHDSGLRKNLGKMKSSSIAPAGYLLPPSIHRWSLTSGNRGNPWYYHGSKQARCSSTSSRMEIHSTFFQYQCCSFVHI
jgi:hypothetical protein